MTKVKSSKSPLLAAALNLIPLPFGLGYLYLGREGRLIASIFLRIGAVAVDFVILVGEITGCAADSCIEESLWPFIARYSVAPGLVLAISALDAYLLARHDSLPERATSPRKRKSAMQTEFRIIRERFRNGDISIGRYRYEVSKLNDSSPESSDRTAPETMAFSHIWATLSKDIEMRKHP